MPVIAGARDPRTIITPEAFEIEPDLLGRPLATPRRRLVAILIDLAVIGLITVATKSFGVLLGIVAAIFFIRAGFKRTPLRNSVFNRAMRLSVGCLGIFIALGTAVGWMLFRGATAVRHHAEDAQALRVNGRSIGGIGDAISLIGGSAALSHATTPDEARVALIPVVERLRKLGLDDAEIRESVLDMMPKDRSWADSTQRLVNEALIARTAATSTTTPPPASTSVPTPEAPESVSALSTADALNAYSSLLRSGADDDASAQRLAALRDLLIDSLAADTLRVLHENLQVERSLAESRARRIDDLTRAAAREQEGGGVFRWIKNAVDELGFGFGWASIYFTIMTSWWSGQTVGKRLMKIRVLRLDGEPMTWWAAFDRAGGYAAGFATGLLGFAQVYWDANRQCIHDRISGTVVVKDGAPKVLDWQDAL